MLQAIKINYSQYKKNNMSDLKTIKFSTNWNRKLDNLIFTTIRKANHYVENRDQVAIVLNDKLYKWAQVIAISECKFSEVGPVMLMLDTGHEYNAAVEIFEKMGITHNPEDTPIKFIVLKTIANPKASPLIQYGSAGSSQQKLEW